MRVVVAWAVTAAVAQAQAQAQAQPVPCEPCARGLERLDALGGVGATLREHAAELAQAAQLDIEGRALSRAQRAELQRWVAGVSRDARDAFATLAGRSDDELIEIGFALCNTPDRSCAVHVAGALRCASGGCTVTETPYPHTCDPSVGSVRSPAYGVGFDYGTGWQRSAHPVDGRAWSLGLEVRERLTETVGLVARLDRSTGRDEARDDDGDGRDDASTGAVTRLTALAGLSLAPLITRDPELVRFLQFDLLGGYLSTRSRSGERGFAIGYDMTYQLAVARLGLRTVVGFGDATEERSVLVHLGFTIGAGPQFTYGVGCDHDRRPEGSPLALALDVPLGGWATELGYLVPGIGIEGALHLHPRLDPLVRWDLLAFPGGDRERSLHQSLLAGVRLDLSRRTEHAPRTGLFGAALAGYTLAAAPSSSPVGSGPIIDVSLGWGAQRDAEAVYLRLHGRLGVGPDNTDLRAVFMSAGAELRLDRRRWRDRD